MKTIFEDLNELLFENRDNLNAVSQSKYLRDLFPFFGLTAPKRIALQKEFFKKFSIDSEESLVNILKLLWKQEQREFQYVAMDLAIKYKKLHSKKILPIFEMMIREKSWWDSVDKIAPNLIGPLALKYPELQLELSNWIDDSDFWIRRASLLFQLKYKKKTDENLLYSLINKTKGEKEFFIRKAIGWVLREYSKTNPDSVRAFLEKTTLSNLSVKEGSKYL